MSKNDSMLVDRLRDRSRPMTMREAQATVEAAAQVLAESPFVSSHNASLVSRALAVLEEARRPR
jgi:hypothetical protein